MPVQILQLQLIANWNLKIAAVTQTNKTLVMHK